MSSPLKCSVVVPTYNRVELLRHTLNSLVHQDLGIDQFEVLVVDDGSSDNTAEMVDTFKDKLNLRYFFKEDEGYRAGQARNIGIAHAEAPILVMIDSGVLLHSGCLSAHLASHDALDGPVAVVGYVYCFNIDNEDAEQINKVIRFDDPDGTIAELQEKKLWPDVREEFYSKHTDEFADLPAPWVVYWTCNVSAPTELLREIGAFDEAYKTWGGEDLDIGFRLHQAGSTFVLNRKAAAIHAPHDKSSAINMAEVAANYQYMLEKTGSPVVALLMEFPAITPFNVHDVLAERGIVLGADGREAKQAAA